MIDQDILYAECPRGNGMEVCLRPDGVLTIGGKADEDGAQALALPRRHDDGPPDGMEFSCFSVLHRRLKFSRFFYVHQKLYI